MEYLDALLLFWIESHWLLALAMAAAVNIAVYVCTAWLLSRLIMFIVNHNNAAGELIDNRPIKKGQIKLEAKNGIIASFIFAVCSLASRELFLTLWPLSVVDFVLQVLCFTVFYETYSYFVHRLLHTKRFARMHGVHHKSVRVTPWSAYSVHPLEALFIGLSAPLYMMLFSLSLGMALVLHISGMMFTILLHSNFKYTGRSMLMRFVFAYPCYHSTHHINGNVNFGFVNKWWDTVFRTLKMNSTSL